MFYQVDVKGWCGKLLRFWRRRREVKVILGKEKKNWNFKMDS